MLFVFTFQPYLGGASTFDDQVNLLKHVFFGVQCTCRRYFDDIAPPLTFCSIELDVAALPTSPLPWCKW